jgi:hypothetical protein
LIPKAEKLQLLNYLTTPLVLHKRSKEEFMQMTFDEFPKTYGAIGRKDFYMSQEKQ